MSYAMMGLEVQTVAQLKQQVEHARELLGPVPTDDLWLPYLGNGLDAGAATMLAQEALVALRSTNGYQTPGGWQGFISDTIMRELGIQLVDGRMPGFALILGPAPTTEMRLSRAQRSRYSGANCLLVARERWEWMWMSAMKRMAARPGYVIHQNPKKGKAGGRGPTDA